MSSPIVSGITALLAAILGAVVTLWVQRQHNLHERLLHQATHETEFMAETTARCFLNHPKWTDRSFAHLRERLGGFTEDELRKILVRAGATRPIREDGSEWWRLLTREAEAHRNRNPTVSRVIDDEDI